MYCDQVIEVLVIYCKKYGIVISEKWVFLKQMGLSIKNLTFISCMQESHKII